MMGLFRGRGGEKQVIDGVNIEEQPSDAPKLKRVYSRSFPWGRIEWEVKTFLGSRRENLISVYQRDGRHIYVWPNDIAEKLIAPEVLADTERFVADVHRIDAAFLASDAARQFADENGHVWQRIK